MGNALEQDIIELYSQNPSSIYSINQIAKKLGKTYPYINKKVTVLIKNNIFKKTVVGRSHLCSLNLQSDETVYLLVLNEITRKKKFLESSKSGNAAASYAIKLAKISGASVAIKHGSKIILVTERDASKTELDKAAVPKLAQPFEQQIVTREEFLKMLKEDQSLLEDHIILHGFERYFHFITEIEDELKLKYSKILQ